AADINAHCGSGQHQIDANPERMRLGMAWIFVHYAPKESPLVRKLPESFSPLSCRAANKKPATLASPGFCSNMAWPKRTFACANGRTIGANCLACPSTLL